MMAHSRSCSADSSSSSRRAHHHHHPHRRSLKPSMSDHHHHHHHPYERHRRQAAAVGRRPPSPPGRNNFAAVAWPSEPATRAILTGFDAGVSARALADELEHVAGTVWRCRVKTSITPPGSFPDFQLSVSGAAAEVFRKDEPSRHGGVAPHAFVHFEHPGAACRAADLFRARVLPAPPRDGGGADDDDTRRRRWPMLFPGSRVEVSDVVAPGTFLAAWRGGADDDYTDPASASASALDFVVDPAAGCCRLLFARDTAFVFPGHRRRPAVLLCCNVKVEFAVDDVAEALAFEADDSLLLRLSAPPLVYYRTAGDDVHRRVPFHLIGANDDPWVRTTDVTPSGAIGRCSAYRVSFAARFWPTMRAALEFMERLGVRVGVCDSRCRGLAIVEEPDFGRPMQDVFFSLQHEHELRFPELYMVNAMIHNGIVSPHQLRSEFFNLLRRAREDVNVAALTELFGANKLYQDCDDPCSRLKNAQDRAAKNLSLLFRSRKVCDHNVFEVRRLIITPTRAYCMPPQAERSNRVIRHYHQLSDRFLRVTFVDEGMRPLNSNALSLHVVSLVKELMSNPSQQQMTTVYRRVQTVLTEGFTMCGRRYSFLAFSTSQLKQKSAWFFAEDETTTVASIKEWMGHFPIRNPAKHAARMGLCFTSSYATVTMRPSEVNENLEDVIQNGYNFSDGIGMITLDLALEVAKRLPLKDKYAPSAYQIRYAGFKGVVAVSPRQTDELRMMSLRPSMKKFESTHSVVEVVSWTKFQPAFLNRQIITLLTSLGVPDAIFWQMQEAMLGNLKRVLSDSNVAYEVVTNSCPEHGSTAGLMLSAGFGATTEPHLRAMLLAIYTSQMHGLLDKTWIFVPKGRWLMGCLDELGILEQGQCFIRVSTPSLNNHCLNRGSIFPSEYKRNAEIIVGTVVMAKNPCLHPGDVRILEAVDVPELHHLVDCLVFPKKGERPHANEASGSDLDGDIYFVTWDENLVPPGRKSCAPMDYSPSKSAQLSREVHQRDTIDFYLESMVNDNLGRICNAHVAHADRSDAGAMDPKCIQLAGLAAVAVDSGKTGEIVRMPPYLSPNEYPDFMGKEDAISYKSKKILGRLYRSILGENDGDFVSQGKCISNEISYDTDLEVPGAESFLEDAWQCKCLYEAQLNTLLSQYGVHSEAEIVTGEIWSLVRYNKKYQYQLKERLNYAYSKLHQEFRSIFESIDVSYGNNKHLAHEMKASAWYRVTYHPEFIRSREPDDEKTPARLSFAWIAVDYLAQIKKKCHGEMKVEEGRSAAFDYLAQIKKKCHGEMKVEERRSAAFDYLAQIKKKCHGEMKVEEGRSAYIF